MKQSHTEEIPLKESASLELVISNFDCPSDERIDEIICEIAELYKLKNTKFEVNYVPIHLDGRVRLNIKAVTVPGGEPVVAVVEVFSQLIGNIRIYERTLKYSRI